MPVKKTTKKSVTTSKPETKEKVKPSKKIVAKKVKAVEPEAKAEIIKKTKKEEKPVITKIHGEAKPASARGFGEAKPAGAKAIWATGRRKNAIAVIRLLPGQGDISINEKLTLNNYLPWIEWQQIVLSPLNCLDEAKNFQVLIRVQGGGKKAQSEAIRLGLAKALSYFNPEWRSKLKSFGYLTRDARVKERKKPGLKRARRAPQWQKR